jgi:hypothetical protein
LPRELSGTRRLRGFRGCGKTHFQEGSAELQIPRLRSEFVTFYLPVQFAPGKLPRASADKHRRGPSTPRRRALCCDRSAKRFAQDDGFVGGLKYNGLDMQKTRKDRKVTGSRDDKGECDASIEGGCRTNTPSSGNQMQLPHFPCHPERSRGICSSADLSWKCVFPHPLKPNSLSVNYGSTNPLSETHAYAAGPGEEAGGAHQS